ncbi:hypothetical protein I317_02892 [Kwoniella heveanensis CBS 569]|nr:hypothetical protein I317_02892 [Kwoniella heveanensis CBS 569]
MSSSSSAAKPSSSSSSKPSSSSSSSSKPSSSSSSSSSSSKEAAKPPSPQPVPTISANAWMSFFLFCCLVLIILQGPLGLTGGSIVPTLPTFGGGWGWSGGMWNAGAGGTGASWLGGMPGCVGVVAGMVPWCNLPQASAQPQPQIQVQQVVQQQNPYEQRPMQLYTAGGGGGHQMGGQGHFAMPGGGGGWSWYSNNPGAGGGGAVVNGVPVVRQQYQGKRPSLSSLLMRTVPDLQYIVKNKMTAEFDEYIHIGQYPQQRIVQYQRPGLQIQVSNGRGQQGT